MYLIGIISNIIAAIVLFGAGANLMNNLQYAIPAIFCIIGACCTIVKMRQDNKNS